MDVQQYIKYRIGGGKTGFLDWEFGGIKSWRDVSTPGRVGERLAEAWTGEQFPRKWADLPNNLMHWGFGIQWGIPFGTIAGSTKMSPALLGPPFGTCIWLFGYAVLPLGRFYQPMWEYDAKTLAQDLGTHLVYGSVTGITFRLLCSR